MKFWGRLLAAAAVATTLAGAAQAQEVLNVRLGSRDIGSIDPALTKTGDDETVVLQVFNSLVAPPRGTLDMDLKHLQPQLAQTWEISDDRKTWTFHLRPHVKWQKDYGEVSAEDVKFSYERQMTPQLGGVHGANYHDIARIDVLDPLTVRFTLKSPDPFFHAAALTPGFGRFIVPEKAVKELGDRFGTEPVGSGPFEFAEYRPQDRVVLKAFDGYFGGRPPMDEIDLRYIPDDNAGTIAFIGGELDLTGGQRTPQWVEKIKQAAPNARVITMLPGSLQFLNFNMKVHPLDDVRVRQAIAYAVDRKVWGQVFGILHGDLTAIVPESFFGAVKIADIPPELRYDYNPDKARELLKQAGYPNGFAIDVTISERDDYLTNLLMVQDMLRKVGITLNLKVQDHATYHADIRKDKGTIAEMSTAIAPTAPSVINEFLSAAAAVGKPNALRNFSHYGEIGGSVDGLVTQALAETDETKQLALLRQAQLQILRDVPVLPLQTAPLVTAVQGNIDLGYQPVSGFGQYEFATTKRTSD